MTLVNRWLPTFGSLILAISKLMCRLDLSNGRVVCVLLVLRVRQFSLPSKPSISTCIVGLLLINIMALFLTVEGVVLSLVSKMLRGALRRKCGKHRCM